VLLINVRIRTVLLCLGLVLVVLAAYGNHFQNGFHFDDSHTILENRFIQNLHNVPGFFTDAGRFNPAGPVYRPLVAVSLAIDFRLAKGYKPFFFHLSTFLWFAVQLVLMVFLFRRIMDRADPHPWNLWTALLAAACYGLHPANAETVNYITQRSEVYSTLGVVASLLCFAAYPGQRKRGWYLLPAIAAYLSSAPALIFPLLLLSYVFLVEQEGTLGAWAENRAENREKWAAAFRTTVPAFAVTAVAALLIWIMTPAATPHGAATSPWLYRATQPWVALHYFKTFFLPTGLSADSDWTPVSGPFSLAALAGYLFVAALLVAAVRTSRRPETRPVAFGILWFFLALLPASLAPMSEVTNDHRMFFPFVGLVLAVFWSLRLLLGSVVDPVGRTPWSAADAPVGLSEQPGSRTRGSGADEGVRPTWLRATLAAVVVLLALAGASTHVRNTVWRTEESLWRDVTVKSPNNARGMMNYAMTFLNHHDYGTALSYLERAESLDPAYGPVESNLGVALAGLDRKAEAERHFQRAVELAPNQAEPRVFYGGWLYGQGRLAESQSQLEAAMRANPLSFPAREVLMEVYNKEGNLQAAHRLMEETVRLAWGDEAARRFMTELAEREKHAREVRFPDSLKPEELVNLSAKLCNNKDYDDCLGAAQKAVNLRPDYAEAYNNMAAAYLAMGRWDEGIAAARQAIRIKPTYDAARSNLEWGLSQKAKGK
jgi:tetratricopeptide (TPR) repeat protein